MSGRLKSWVAFVLSLAAVLAVASALQSFAEVWNRRFDLTLDRGLSLSPYTLSVLSEIHHPLRVELYYQRGERQRSRELLELMRDHCANLSYELVDLDRNPGRAKEHGVDHYDRALLLYQGREVVVGAGAEETLTGGIAKILHEKPRVLYYLTGHRERSLAPGPDDGYGRAAQILRNEGFEVRTLSLLQADRVPSDASAVVLGGPEVDLVEGEIVKLESFLEDGGAVLVLADPFELPVLSAWLARHGIALRDDVVIDRANRVYGTDGTNVVVPFFRDHEATKAMDVPAVLGRARSLHLTNGKDDDEVLGASVVARTANESFAAADASRTKKGEVELDRDRDEPGPIGVIAVAYAGADRAKAGRLLVVGDADFASDDYIALLGNKDLLVSAVGWLVSDRASGTRPREQAAKLGPVSPVYVSDEHGRIILVSAAVVQPLVFLVIGVVVVVARRRRR